MMQNSHWVSRLLIAGLATATLAGGLASCVRNAFAAAPTSVETPAPAPVLCNFYYDEVVASEVLPIAEVFNEIFDDTLTAAVEAAVAEGTLSLSGDEVVSRGFIYEFGGFETLGLEIDGCLVPPIVLSYPTIVVPGEGA
jgi:hypothetical protein